MILYDEPAEIGPRKGRRVTIYHPSAGEAGSARDRFEAETEALALLKARNPYLSLQPVADVEALGCPMKTIFERERAV
jgi:hypothetical protein